MTPHDNSGPVSRHCEKAITLITDFRKVLSVAIDQLSIVLTQLKELAVNAFFLGSMVLLVVALLQAKVVDMSAHQPVQPAAVVPPSASPASPAIVFQTKPPTFSHQLEALGLPHCGDNSSTSSNPIVLVLFRTAPPQVPGTLFTVSDATFPRDAMLAESSKPPFRP